MDARLSEILAELRRGLLSLYGERLSEVVLFGSQARGEAMPDSDIDVMVVLSGQVNPYEEIRRGGPLVANVSLRYDTLLSCVFVSEERYQAAASPLLRTIRREGVAA